jgi:hypothetical protein
MPLYYKSCLGVDAFFKTITVEFCINLIDVLCSKILLYVLEVNMSEEPRLYTRSDLRFSQYAGLFDGEGSIGMYPIRRAKVGSRWRYRIALRVEMTSRETVSRMHAQFGAGTFKTYPIRPGRKQSWVWFCGSRADIIRILQRFLVHDLLDLKAHEAKLALDYLLAGELTDTQQDLIYKAMRLPKCRQKLHSGRGRKGLSER